MPASSPIIGGSFFVQLSEQLILTGLKTYASNSIVSPSSFVSSNLGGSCVFFKRIAPISAAFVEGLLTWMFKVRSIVLLNLASGSMSFRYALNFILWSPKRFASVMVLICRIPSMSNARNDDYYWSSNIKAT